MSREPRFIDDNDAGAPRKRESASRFEEDTKSGIKIERIEDDVEQKPERSDDGEKRGGGKKVALLIAALLLGFAIIGAGVYALIHFVFMPNDVKGGEVEATETLAPTMPEEPTLTPIPTQPPTEAPTEPEYNTLADEYIKNMSDREKICQMFIVTPEVLTASEDDSEDSGAVTVAGDMTKKSLEEYPVGGLIYFAGNLEDADQVRSMIRNSQRAAKTPMFISVDEEGGDVARVAQKLGTKKFYPMFNYKDYGEEIAHDVAGVNAFNIRRFGFNMDYAPVADVLSNPANTVIGKRAYSDDFAQAASLVAAAVKGYDEGEVISVLKHFPGHGGTAEDSHEELAVVEATVDDLKKNELLPFKSGIEAGADMVMVGHLVVKDLDPDLPATLSSKVVPELLRKYLGYDGIVISDSMSMGAIQDFDYNTIVKGLFAADVDIILQPDNIEKYIEAFDTLLDSGDITMEQIDAKVRKIIALKYKQGILKSDLITAADETTAATDAAIAPTTDATDAEAPQAPAETVVTDLPVETAAPAEEPTVAA